MKNLSQKKNCFKNTLSKGKNRKNFSNIYAYKYHKRTPMHTRKKKEIYKYKILQLT